MWNDLRTMREAVGRMVQRAWQCGYRPVAVIVGDAELWRNSLREGDTENEWPDAVVRIAEIYRTLKRALVFEGAYVIDATEQFPACTTGT